MSIEKLMNDELVARLTDLQDLKVESQEYKLGVDSVSKLSNALVEMMKAEAEITAQEERQRLEEKSRNLDDQLKVKQQKADTFDKIARNAITGVVGIGGICVTVWGTCKSLKFEETGVCTASATKKFFGHILSYFKK